MSLVGLIEHVGPDMLVNGRMSTLSTWLDTLPLEVLSTRPSIISLQGSIASTTGDVNLALNLYRPGHQCHVSSPGPPGNGALPGVAGWNTPHAGDLNAAITDAHETIRLVED